MIFNPTPLTSSAKCPVDKVCSCLKVDTHVIVTGVMSRYAQIGDLHSLIDIWFSPIIAVSCIQDVSDLVLVQISLVLCTVSGKHNILYLLTRELNTAGYTACTQYFIVIN